MSRWKEWGSCSPALGVPRKDSEGPGAAAGLAIRVRMQGGSIRHNYASAPHGRIGIDVSASNRHGPRATDAARQSMQRGLKSPAFDSNASAPGILARQAVPSTCSSFNSPLSRRNPFCAASHAGDARRSLGVR